MPKDGCPLGSLGLGDEEVRLIEKFLNIIRANPEKAEKMVNEEETNLITVTQLHSLRSGNVKRFQRREAENKMKMAKKNKVSKRKKDQNVKSKEGESVKSEQNRNKKTRKLGKKGKRIANKNNNKKLEREKKNKIKLTLKMKKKKHKRKETQRNRQKTKFLGKSEVEKCMSLWVELTDIGLGVATSVRKQVIDIDLVIQFNYLPLAGKYHYKE